MMATNLTEIPWQLGSGFEVIVPIYIGDSELVNIAMSLERLELTLSNHGYRESHGSPVINSSIITIVYDRPEFVWFESDHLQNVVSAVHIFDRTNAHLARHVENSAFKYDIRDISELRSSYFILVTPMTGIDLLAGVQCITFYEERLPTYLQAR
jgi:hypothetical protein